MDRGRVPLQLRIGLRRDAQRVSTGAGRVLVCNLWALDGIRRGYPEAGYLLDCLVTYAAAEAPETQFPALSTEDATAMFRIENETPTQ